VLIPFRRWPSLPDDTLSGHDPPSPLARWVAGVIIPLLILCIALYAGIGWGAILLGVALLMHAHYFLAALQGNIALAQVAHVLGALLAIGGVGYLIFGVLVFG